MTPENEKWLPVLGYEGLYEVSDLGRVRSVDRQIVRSDGAPVRLSGKLRVSSVGSRGRRTVSLKREGTAVNRAVHRLVLEAFVGPRPDGFAGCHNDGDCLNDRLSNLRWDSISENVRDEVRHGTHRMTRRTHCPADHLLREPNLVLSSLPNRKCKACHRAQATVSNAKRAGREPGNRRLLADDHYAKIMR